MNISHHLVFQPQGMQRIQTKSFPLDPSGQLQMRTGTPAPGVVAGDHKQFISVPLVLPAEAVPDSAHCSVSVTGEVMGPIVQAVVDGAGFNNLIRMPTGCGEQTMLTLGPMVYVAKYLKESNQLTSDEEEQLRDFINKGRSVDNGCLWDYQMAQGRHAKLEGQHNILGKVFATVMMDLLACIHIKVVSFLISGSII